MHYELGSYICPTAATAKLLAITVKLIRELVTDNSPITLFRIVTAAARRRTGVPRRAASGVFSWLIASVVINCTCVNVMQS